MSAKSDEFGEFSVQSLGECSVPSPLRIPTFRQDNERVLADPTIKACEQCRGCQEQPPSFEIAGPREKIFFDPATVRAGIVTCGGLCPGLNDVHSRFGHGALASVWDVDHLWLPIWLSGIDTPIRQSPNFVGS